MTTHRTIPLRCRFGIHRWTPWGRLRIQREVSPGVWRPGEGRFCLRCSFADTRWPR